MKGHMCTQDQTCYLKASAVQLSERHYTSTVVFQVLELVEKFMRDLSNTYSKKVYLKMT